MVSSQNLSATDFVTSLQPARPVLLSETQKENRPVLVIHTGGIVCFTVRNNGQEFPLVSRKPLIRADEAPHPSEGGVFGEKLR